MKKIDLIDYNYFRVSAITLDIRIADIKYNLQQHKDVLIQLSKKGVSLAVFPELSITGYTAGDLFYQHSLLNKVKKSLSDLAITSETYDIAMIVGCPIETNGKLFNTAVFISNGKIMGIVPKSFLCNNSEYYEERWFSADSDKIFDYIYINDEKIPFGADLLFSDKNYNNLKVGIEICEDLWAMKPPSADLAIAGANIICNLSASNEYLGKTNMRYEKIKEHSRRLMTAYVYSSCGTGESSTDTVFSGHSIIAESGNISSQTERFNFGTQYCISDIDLDILTAERIKNNSFGGALLEKNIRVINIEFPNKEISTVLKSYPQNPFLPYTGHKKKSEITDIISIQKTALATRLRAINCKNVVVGLSGGLDSTLALLIIIETFKTLKYDLSGILVLTLPGFGTSNRTKGNAELLTDELGVILKTISIDKAVRQHFEDIRHNENTYDITYENAQARERTQILMDMANKHNAIVIGTGDMSELALGWCTYNADQMSMYNVNAGLPKTLVFETVKYFAEYIYHNKIAIILNDICATPISPELLPTDNKGNIKQKTEDNIGPYELHDFFLYHILKNNLSATKIVLIAENTFAEKYSRKIIISWLKVFYQRFISQQFKRSAMPDGPKVCITSLSPRAELRLPSDASYKLWLDELNDLE